MGWGDLFSWTGLSSKVKGQVKIQAEVFREMGKGRSLPCFGMVFLGQKQMFIFALDRGSGRKERK